MAKPNQDFRFDIPVICVDTIYTIRENRILAMAVESDATMISGRNKALDIAMEI